MTTQQDQWRRRALAHLTRALIALGGALPAAWLWPLGRVLGVLAALPARRRRRIAWTNLALCFPDLPPSARRRLLRAHLRALGVSLLETAMAWRGRADLIDGRIHIDGLDSLRSAREAGGVLLLGAHFVTMEIAGMALAREIELDVVQRAHDDATMDALQRVGRGRHFARLIDRRDLRGMLRALAAGRVLWYAADQDYGRRHSRFVPFFGIATATIAAPLRLARRTGVRVLFVEHWRDDAERCWHLRIRDPGSDWAQRPDAEALAELNRIIEAAVRAHPEQYLWMHRRFKTRPEGEPDCY